MEGSFRLGQCGPGGIARNSSRDIIMDYAVPLGHGTNITADAFALSYRLKWCLDMVLEIFGWKLTIYLL